MGATAYVYAAPKDVENFLLLQQAIDTNSVPTAQVIAAYITHAEGEFEKRTGTAFKPVLVTREIHDLESIRSRYKELFDDDWFSVPRPVHLDHRPLIPFDTARGHAVEVYEGADSVAFDGKWSPEYLADRTFGRNRDWWVDEAKGIVYVRKNFLFRRASLMRFTYEYGKEITTTTASVAAGAATIPAARTLYYQTRGLGRLDDEYVFYTGKTTTSFTGVQRGLFGTQDVTHASGSEIYQVPEDVRRLVTQRAAQKFLENEAFVAVVGDNAGGANTISEKVRMWQQDWDRTLSFSYKRWETF